MRDLTSCEITATTGGVVFIPLAIGYLCGVAIGAGTVVGVVEGLKYLSAK